MNLIQTSENSRPTEWFSNIIGLAKEVTRIYPSVEGKKTTTTQNKQNPPGRRSSIQSKYLACCNFMWKLFLVCCDWALAAMRLLNTVYKQTCWHTHTHTRAHTLAQGCRRFGSDGGSCGLSSDTAGGAAWPLDHQPRESLESRRALEGEWEVGTIKINASSCSVIHGLSLHTLDITCVLPQVTYRINCQKRKKESVRVLWGAGRRA